MSVVTDLAKHLGRELSYDERRLALRLKLRQEAPYATGGSSFKAHMQQGTHCVCGTVAKPTRRGIEAHSDPDGEPCYARRIADEIRVGPSGYRLSTRERVCPTCMLPHCVCER